MLPSTTDLIYFFEVAKELHFSRAAKKLNVTQPSLSLAIKRLEEQLKMSLFIRHKQGVTLTRAGKELHTNVSKLLAHWNEIFSNLQDANHLVKGRVSIGCHSTLAPFMSGMVADLFAQYPGLEIHFQHEFREKIMEWVVKGDVEMHLYIINHCT